MNLPAEARPDVERPSPRRPEECVVEDWLTFLGHRWNALLLWQLSAGPKRYGELAECLPGITPKVMAERLKGLEQRGLMTRELLMSYPRGVRYGLSSRGKQIVAILDQIESWSSSQPA